jgi:hypothetical protein
MEPSDTRTKRKTLADSLRLVKEPDGFQYAIANFLDRFKNDPTSEMLEENLRSSVKS